MMPLDEIRPGMKGVGHTVFTGSRIEEFQVEILGVLRNVIGPKRGLVLARLSGGPLAQSGVIAGMSGSPVYIDGRLIGAVSYSLGSFSKEPIAGITPIAEMIELAALDTPRPPVKAARLELPVTREGLSAALRQSFSWLQPFAERSTDVQAVGVQDVSVIAPMLRPIATPLVMSGFHPEVGGLVTSAFREYGFEPAGTGGAAVVTARTETPQPLRPGDAVGVNLITGDLSLGGVGTVTHVDGDRVYAFGHPFYNIGPTQFPMTRAHIHTVLPSLFSSIKIAETGDTIGTFQQDRSTTIAGRLGGGPKLIPIDIALETARGVKKELSLKVVEDQLFTPLLTYVSILNSLTSYEREFGAATFTVKGQAMVKKHDTIAFEDIFSGDSPSIGAATYIVGPIAFLLTNDFERVELEGLKLSIATSEQPKTATIERVWLDTVKPRAGRSATLKLLVRTYRGEGVTYTVPIDIPANVSGTLSIMVSDGSRLAQWEQREVRQSLKPSGVANMIRALNKSRKNNRLYIKLLSSDAGAVINGELLSSLPPSVLSVLEGDRNGGNFVPLRSATLGEWEVATDHAVSGVRFLTVNVDSSN
ncbi:MAG: hypothetical protein HYZ58_17355 [Acidobacteria bacterium]|nr:hypothetical protein [Acidobacteriota bacterium]MBI3264895.1 hypothetical protein [Acidobacteriota bacterium]